MRGEWIFAALLLGGCDVVFRIDRIGGVTSDAGDDDPDAPPQTAGCDEDSHDEDGDGFGDECDRCPGIGDDQADVDGDGVGDVCDPSSLAMNYVALFVSFADNNVWRTVAGNWPRDGESLIYDAVTLDAYGITLYQGVAPEPPFVLEYHFAVDSIQAQGSGVAVILDADADGRGVTCGIQRHEQPIRDVVRNTYGQASVSSETDIMSVTSGGYRVTTTYDPKDEIRCVLAADNGTAGGSTTLGLPVLPAPGTFGFRSLRVGMQLHYVAIYKEH